MFKRVGAALTLVVLAGCADMSYYLQSARGHLALMHAARPIQDWLDDPATPAELRQRLELAQRMRRFAVERLHLPDNASYHRYADLHRQAAVWNAVAAPPYSLTLKTWCFPFTGCIGYRGYFDEAEARALAEQLHAEGMETNVYGVPAYSTLGWMNWLGGDPLLNTFIRSNEGELARLLFHELAHQVVYVQDDTTFNESYATAVERLGGAEWLASQAGEGAREAYLRFDGRRRELRALMLKTRQALAAVYADGADPEPMEQRKARVMAQFHEAYARLKREHWAGFAGYDAYIARANNAVFGVQAAYDGLVPAFEALFAREGGDWARFHAAVAALAARPKAERDAALAALVAR
ncbi:putative aminopeptidase [Pseudorhodoferax soli]|uniref:Putative aminopeptidase n=2 Tax=Pseudorhodoferax soli TaxID=545864 RepID=A0A368XH66_9BURK|nr:putative aminopeptidase [Pseudorhodoferax soli]